METAKFLRQRGLRIKEAFELFEVHKGFPSAQIQILERTEAIAKDAPEEAQKVRSEARLAYLIRILDAHAEAYLELIDDIKHQKAYSIVLDEYMRKSWEEFTGMPMLSVPHESIQRNSQIGSLEARFKHWVMEGYRRLVTSVDKSERPEAKEEPATPDSSQLARPFSAFDHPSAVVRGNQMLFDAESRAQAELHYEKTLEKLRQREGQLSKSSSAQLVPHPETIGEQIKRLRDESRWTIEKLAEVAQIHERTVARHESGDVTPYARTLSAYERIFSKRLERKVVISKMP